jgi:hypothetical protein
MCNDNNADVRELQFQQPDTKFSNVSKENAANIQDDSKRTEHFWKFPQELSTIWTSCMYQIVQLPVIFFYRFWRWKVVRISTNMGHQLLGNKSLKVYSSFWITLYYGGIINILRTDSARHI